VPAKTLSTVLSQVVEAKAEYDVRLLAQQLGTNYRSLMYWMRGDRHLPAYLLPRICTILRNYEPLDLLESQAGRVAFKIPDPKQTQKKSLRPFPTLLRTWELLWRASPTPWLTESWKKMS
jgi:hypothetical protein